MTPSVHETQGGVALPPTPATLETKFDLGIALSLHAWPALTLAVQNSWGGPDSAEKRDWFAGAISDLMASTSDADVEYVEEFLLQVMNDEFDVNVEDGSGEEVAARIVGLRKLTREGDLQKIDDMFQDWTKKKTGGSNAKSQFLHVQRNEDDDDTDWDSDDGQAEDAEMKEAPPLVRVPKEKVLPKIDADGFTEVVSRKRR